MAKPKAPLLSFGAIGTVAKKVTYAKRRGETYARQHVIPLDPKTGGQQTSRDTLSTANSIWKVAPPLSRAPWDRFAAGEVKSGYNAFVGRFVSDNRGAPDLLGLTFSPGAKGGLAPAAMVLVAGPLQITVDITAPAAPTGWILQAAIAATIRDGDPATTTFFTTTAGQDLTSPFQVVLTGLTDGALYVVGAWLRWAKPDGSIAFGPSLAGTATPALPYDANAVQFDGANDWLERDADLTGILNGKVGTLSYWLDLTGGDSTNMNVLINATAKLRTFRHSNNTIRVSAQAAALVLNMLSLTSFTAAGGWFHVLAAWDLGNLRAELWINDADDLDVPSLTLIDDTIQYSAADWGVGAAVGGSAKLNSGVADLYFNSEVFIDIAIEANRRKFIDSAGKPVDLGADGSLPTGTAPIGFFEGPTDTWHTNDGSGGGFTEFGALTTAASSPSD